MDLFRGWFELQQFDEPVAVNNLARRGGDVATDLERGFISLADSELAAALTHVRARIAQSFDKALPAGLKHCLEGGWIGGKEVCRR